MNRKHISVLFLLISGSLFGQNQGYLSPDSWKKYIEALTFDLKLEPVSLGDTNFHIRIWNIGQVIDLWKDNSRIIHGEITSYAKQYDEMNLGKRTFHSSGLPIKQEDASAIYNLITSSSITSIPDGDKIEGWSKKAEGYTEIIECTDSGQYSFKCYLSPANQGALKEAMTIQSFLVKLDHLLKLNKIYKSFSASIPFWCYTKGTTEVICRKK